MRWGYTNKYKARARNVLLEKTRLTSHIYTESLSQPLSQNSVNKPPENLSISGCLMCYTAGAVPAPSPFCCWLTEAIKEVQKQAEPSMSRHKFVSNQPSPPLAGARNMPVCPHNFINLLLKKTDHTGHRNVKQLPKLFSF